MRYFYDTEFHEDGQTIDLISIAIVAEDGREYYAVNADADWDRIKQNPWLMENVVPQLPMPGRWKPKATIKFEVTGFLLADGEPELWADYSAYDHVALCRLWGKMIDLPQGVPMFTNDFQSYLRFLGLPDFPEQAIGVHDALEDARYLKRMFDCIPSYEVVEGY